MDALKGKVAVVTGASEGIGEGIARRLAAEGMRVAVLDKKADMLKKLEDELNGKGYTVKSYKCDIQIEEDVTAAFKAIDDDFGGINVMINNAGVMPLSTLTDIKLEVASLTVNTNVLGTLTCTREAFSSMKKHSINIVILNSICGHRNLGYSQISIYSASKHALTDICHSLRTELSQQKLKTRITSISPGLVKTTMSSSAFQGNTILPHLVPSDIANAVIYAISAPSNVNISEIIIEPV